MTLVAVTVVSIGCASMHHGRSQHVIVTSDSARRADLR